MSPIILRLNFSLVGDSASSGNLRPVLAVGSQDHVTASVSSCPVESPATGWLHCVSLCLRTHSRSQSPTSDDTPKDAPQLLRPGLAGTLAHAQHILHTALFSHPYLGTSVCSNSRLKSVPFSLSKERVCLISSDHTVASHTSSLSTLGASQLPPFLWLLSLLQLFILKRYTCILRCPICTGDCLGSHISRTW